jgi:LuxR family maltose regulon positive regulatory protein
MLADDDPGAARACVGPTLRDEVPALPSTLIEAWALEAVANDQLADHASANAALERALDHVEPVGYRRPLMIHRAALRPILRRHLGNTTEHRALVEQLLREFEATNGDRAAPPMLVDSLSDRERAVLRYLPTMMSNQEIAGELFVSVNTVKTHLRAIYRKLDAADRREAVRRARDLELLAR